MPIGKRSSETCKELWRTEITALKAIQGHPNVIKLLGGSENAILSFSAEG